MLTTVAALVIVLGLMVSLARDVRSRSATRLTQDLLRTLDEVMSKYAAKTSTPAIPPFVTEPGVDEQALHQRALENNRQVVNMLVHDGGLKRGDVEAILSIVRTPEHSTVRDAWGGPIVFMASQQPLIGMAPGDRHFFFSAGPDGRYLTRADNLYSYDFTTTDDFTVKKP